ncbi:matrixin family metalloprotease [Microcystis aeruginosa]|uniref:matrixin family metalloprotease n=1 Tax=Microcystis aeruginosa TaxID=1126 RepID=UPI00232B4E6E|nr:matrixin family metalloprotease [Microcystis aeruginosa]MDB9414606.1 hypothetical protein [Microcystis aeruginosa CS-567/02]
MKSKLELKCINIAEVIFYSAIFSISLINDALSQIPIDPGLPSAPSQTLSLPVPYSFRTSWDGITWTNEQKLSTRNAISYLGNFFIDQPAFYEEASPDDFTLRWAGNDFFQNWPQGTFKGLPLELNLSTAIAFSAKPGIENPPWDTTKYPLNEIYFNNQYRWHYNPFTLPDEGDPNDHTDGEFDFWSILLHEIIHMLSVNTHASHSDEVMYESISDGDQKYQLKQSDIDLLKEAGYKVSLQARPRSIPEPTSTLSLIALCTLGAASTLKRKLKSSKSSEKETTTVS